MFSAVISECPGSLYRPGFLTVCHCSSGSGSHIQNMQQHSASLISSNVARTAAPLRRQLLEKPTVSVTGVRRREFAGGVVGSRVHNDGAIDIGGPGGEQGGFPASDANHATVGTLERLRARGRDVGARAPFLVSSLRRVIRL